LLLTLLSIDGDIAMFEIYGLTLCSGLKRPVLAELVAEVVPEHLYKRAIADSAASYNIARLVGPAVGGALVALVGIGAAFALGALFAAGVAITLLSIHASRSVHRNRYRDTGSRATPERCGGRSCCARCSRPH